MIKIKYPQYAGLNSQIDTSYTIAQAYYTARENQFKKIVFNNSVKALKNFSKELYETARAYRPEVLDQIQDSLDGKAILPPKAEYQVDLNRLYEAALKDNRALELIAGIDFEHYLVQHARLNDAQGKKIENYTVQHVGTVVNSAFTTKGAKDTRTDMAVTNKKITNDTGLELKIGIDLHDKKLQELGSERKITNQLMRMMANNEIDLEIFGFQDKTYKGLSGQKWMGSKPLADALRQIFDNGKPWSSNYAELYAAYYLSKYIINIINPVNIGIVYTNGFQFMSEFLQNNRFYMDVTGESISPNRWVEASAKRGGGYEIIPSPASNLIRMRTLQKGSQMLQAKTALRKDNSLKITLASVAKQP